jgi:hypothetical protein
VHHLETATLGLGRSLKDIEASIAAVQSKMSTRTREIADHYSEDFEETVDEWGEEYNYILEKGLDPTTILPQSLIPRSCRAIQGTRSMSANRPLRRRKLM